ncbi:MAG TPA: serine hydrolase domain-containing protein [Chloroflexia bacterium]|nr:serine hydrolase domain-containing protein [Chloroflexia bacterium]
MSDELGQELSDYLSRLVPFGFAGAVLAAREGVIIEQGGYGLADRARRVPVTAETLFDIASFTKWFTAVAILKLAQEGKLDLGDTINLYFEDVPPDKTGITIHQLLTHTAGLQLYSGEDYEAISRDDAVKRILDAPLQAAPGAEYHYSNPSYSLLGAIIEIVSGMTYEAYLNKYLFKPAHMTKTGYVLPIWESDKVMHCYDGARDAGTPLDLGWMQEGPGWNLHANGGMLSTVGDLYKWHLALEDDTLLSEEARGLMLTPYVQAVGTLPEGASSGYGVYISKKPRGTRLITRGGTSDYSHAGYEHFVDEDVVLIMLASRDNFPVRVVEENLVSIIFGPSTPAFPPAAMVELTASELDEYCGVYLLPSGAKLSIGATESALVITPSGQEAINLFMEADPQQLAHYAELNALATSIVEAMAVGDFGPLEVVTPPERVQPRRRHFEKLWQSWSDSYTGYRVIGTAPSSLLRSVGAAATIVALDMKDGLEYLTFLWKDGELDGTINGLVEQRATVAVSHASTEFVAFNLITEVSTPIRFHLTSEGKATKLSVRPDEGEYESRVAYREEQ